MNEASENQVSSFQPQLLGGSVSYDLDLSGVGCGFVAGLYSINLHTEGDSSFDPKTQAPSCPQFDIMKANKYGFSTSAHACPNGNCDVDAKCVTKIID